jgi:hypothetical protein
MKWCVLIVLAVGIAAGQQQRVQTYTYDGTGNSLTGPQTDISKSPSGSNVTQRMQSINGRMVPRERIEDRVLSEDAQGKVTERIVRPYDPNGDPGPPERIVTEERTEPDGSTVTTATTYRGDINGNMAVAERSVTQTHPTATGSVADTMVERNSINNSFETVEKSTATIEKSTDGQTTDTVVYRKNTNGDFYEAARQTDDRKKVDGATVDNTADYQASPSGSMELIRQTVQKTVQQPDGSEQTQIDVYAPVVPGVAGDPDNTAPKLRVQELVDKQPTAKGTVETVIARRPTISDPTRLGPPVRVAETVCTGSCK